MKILGRPPRAQVRNWRGPVRGRTPGRARSPPSASAARGTLSEGQAGIAHHGPWPEAVRAALEGRNGAGEDQGGCRQRCFWRLKFGGWHGDAREIAAFSWGLRKFTGNISALPILCRNMGHQIAVDRRADAGCVLTVCLRPTTSRVPPLQPAASRGRSAAWHWRHVAPHALGAMGQEPSPATALLKQKIPRTEARGT